MQIICFGITFKYQITALILHMQPYTYLSFYSSHLRYHSSTTLVMTTKVILI